MLFRRRGLFRVAVLLKVLNFIGSVRFLVSYVLPLRGLRVKLFALIFLQSLRGAGQSFSGKNFDRRA